MKIFLHGYMQELHPEPIEVQATSVAEAISALQLIPALQPLPGQRHTVIVDGFGSRDAIYDRTDVTEIHLRPVLMGAGGKNAGWVQIIIGIIFIVAALMSGGTTMMLGGVVFQTSTVMMVGAMMVLGGVMQLLAPQPKIDSMTQEEKSRYLGAPKNTVAIGTRIPMLIGRRKAYGHYISFDVDAGDFNAAPATWYSSPFTSHGELTHSAIAPSSALGSPATVDSEPTSIYTGLLLTTGHTFISFSPGVSLAAGQWLANFGNGLSISVDVATTGTVTLAEVVTGLPDTMPASGTAIAFTRNYG